MADFSSIVGPYETQYPDLEFSEIAVSPDPVFVKVVNPANSKESEAEMPIPFNQAEFDLGMEQAIQAVVL